MAEMMGMAGPGGGPQVDITITDSSGEEILADLNCLFDGEISEFRVLTRSVGIELLAS